MATGSHLVRWYDAGAQRVREAVVDVEVDGRLPRDLALRLDADGGVLLSMQPRPRAAMPTFGGGRLDVGWWCRELRTLVVAGMTVVEALETLNTQTRGAGRERVNAQLIAALHEGKSLSEAMRQTQAFPPILVAGIVASERTSGLVEALDEFLHFDELVRRLRRQVLSAAIYPAVVVSLGLLISLFLLLFVVPRFTQMYADLRGELSMATRMLVGVSHLVSTWWPALAAGAIGLAAAIAWGVRTGRLQRGVARIAARIEPLQRQIDEYRLAKLFQALALMFRGGYPLDDALAQCRRLGLGERIAGGIDLAHAALLRGERVSAALERGHLTDAVSLRLLATGERTGNFDRVLRTIAERHAERFGTFVERATRLVEPVLLLLVALLVGSIVIMMYMPIFDIANGLG